MAEQKRKQRRKILTEEDYTSTLTHIVTRDYYPSLYSLRRDAQILDARSRGDIASAVAIRREARRHEMQREQEWMEDEAQEVEASSNETSIVKKSAQNVIGIRKRPRLLKHETITGFHDRVTSEDNAEFESNQEEESRQREIHLGVIYSSAADKAGRLAIEAAVNGKVVREETEYKRSVLCDTPLGLASDLYNASPSAGLRITGDNAKKAEDGVGRNGLFFQPQHIDEHEQTQPGQHLMLESGAKSTGNFLSLTNGDSISDNLLMPPPPARKSGNLTLQSAHDAIKSDSNNNILGTYQLVEYQPKPLVPHINPPATRFPNQIESRLTTISARKANRQSLDSETSDATDLDEVPPSLEDERAARRQAKIREHETFVPMTPLIQPGMGGAAAAGALDTEPIMTWGNVASTPLVLGNGVAVDKSNRSAADWEPTQPTTDTGAVEFDVVEETSREKLAQRAEKKLNDRSRTYKSAGSKALLNKGTDYDDASTFSDATSVASSATTRGSFDRSASLTPAARALLEASNKATKSTTRSHSNNVLSKSRIFQPSPVSSSKISSASRNSFGSALRMAYTPGSVSSSMKRKKPRDDGKATSLRRAAEGSTPRVSR